MNQSDTIGGAAKAAARIHAAVRKSGVNSRFFVSQVSHSISGTELTSGRWDRFTRTLRQRVARQVTGLLSTDNVVSHEPALFSTAVARRLRNSDADIAHLHWVSDNMLSVAAIGNLRMPIVWTLHDMWAFCGAEHYADDSRWQNGYTRVNRPEHESGWDLNRWVWSRKRLHWKRPMQIVAPSRWLADCTRRSALMAEWPVEVIPNAIDIEFWAPVDKRIARQALGLPDEVPLVLFGAMGGHSDPRKGFDLLTEALDHLSEQGDLDLMLMVFGGSRGGNTKPSAFPIHCFGHLSDDLSLRLIYNAADLLVIPSRLDNLPNTGLEALACATPLVGFDVGGIGDLICHRETGYLAKAEDPADLAEGIRWVVAQRRHDLSTRIGTAARKHAETRFAEAVVAEQYLQVYQTVLDYQNAAATQYP